MSLKVNPSFLKIKPLAVVAAISADQGLIHWDAVENSINSTSFTSFLEEVKKSQGDRDVTILLDNATFHKSKLTLARAEEMKIRLVFNIPYEP